MGIISAVGRANVGIVDYENFIKPTPLSIQEIRGSPGESARTIDQHQHRNFLEPAAATWGSDSPFPSQMVKHVMGSLIEGKVIRGWLRYPFKNLPMIWPHNLRLPTPRRIGWRCLWR